MRRPLAVKILVLLLFTTSVALSSAFIFRQLIIDDFRSYREGELEDRVYWVTARLEGAYREQRGWAAPALADHSAWALLLGMEVRLTDHAGRVVMDTAQALSLLPAADRERVLAVSGYLPATAQGSYTPYPLFLGGKEIGTLGVRFVPRWRPAIFEERASRFLFWSSLLIGGIAILVGIAAARRLSRPLVLLTAAAEGIGKGDLTSRVPAHARDEIGRLGQTFNRMAEELQLQERLRRTLFANAAHELRTPLTAIRCELEGMMDGLIPSSREQLQSLHDETTRLTSLLAGMEDLSSAEASSLNLQRQSVQLGPFLGGIMERYRALFDEKGVALLSAAADDDRVDADPELLSRIVVNLLGNALRATPAGGTVTVKSEPVTGGTAISVTDTGCGIAADALPRIFERFYRGAGGGMGLGLAIVKELVEAHGGRIEVESRVGEGSRFTVLIPAGSHPDLQDGNPQRAGRL